MTHRTFSIAFTEPETCASLIRASAWSVGLRCVSGHSCLCVHRASGACMVCTAPSTWGAGSGSLGRCCSTSVEEGPPSNGVNKPQTYWQVKKRYPCFIGVCWGGGQRGALVAPGGRGSWASKPPFLTVGTYRWDCLGLLAIWESHVRKIAGRWESGPRSLALCSNALRQEGPCPW